MQAAVLYANGDLIYLGWLGSLIGCGIISGQMFGGFLGKRIGKVKYQCMTMFLIGGTFLGCKYLPTQRDAYANVLKVLQ